jgi:hypothetical protein
MSEDTKPEAAKEDEGPSMTERAQAAVHDLEHACRHNAPVSVAMIAEIKALLGVK